MFFCCKCRVRRYAADGSLWVWGNNANAELGLGNITQYITPQHLLPPTDYVFTSVNANAYGYHAVATLALAPEPTSLSIIALAAGALLDRRRRLA